MERTQEHLSEDTILRAEFINQVSWDEWVAIHAPFFLVPQGREMVENTMKKMVMNATYDDALDVAVQEWRKTLDRKTRYAEVLYLMGYSHVERTQIIDQDHAALRNRAIQIGLIEERPQDIQFRDQFGN